MSARQQLHSWPGLGANVTRTRSYAVVTPARNEAENLQRLATCLAQQSEPPAVWVIVDDGSTDDTLTAAEALAREHSWADVRSSAAVREKSLVDGRRTARDVVAFRTGVESLASHPYVVVKLDADVSIGAGFFARILDEFDDDPSLGITGGLCYEERDGQWQPMHATGSHVRGATRAYRWTCYEAVAPLVERIGWDAVDEFEAAERGWTTRTIDSLPFRHHRVVGARDRSHWQAWADQGELAHFLGYRPSYLAARTLYRAWRHPAALGLLWGFSSAVVRRKPRYPNRSVRESVRRQQSLRSLPQRRREALGR